MVETINDFSLGLFIMQFLILAVIACFIIIPIYLFLQYRKKQEQ